MIHARPWLLIGLLVYTVAIRLLPYVLQNCDVKVDPTIIFYPWNFSPLTAVCLMCGATIVDRRLSFALPLTAMLISNIGIGLLTGRWEWAFPATWWMPYACFALAVWMGMLLRRRGQRHPLLAAVGMGLGFEVVFFAASNFIYFYGSGSLYPQTWAGLLDCYAAALPFFRNAPLGTLAFTLLLFGPLGVAEPRMASEPSDNLVPVPSKS